MESLAQVGVQLLLFSLGLEFSLSKLRAVRSVALAGAQPCRRLQSPGCLRPRPDLPPGISLCLFGCLTL